jgi:hypothetical protein
MKSKRNLWPYGILLTFVLFISGTITLIVIACTNNADLVSRDYYEEEMRFQTQIDRLDRAQQLDAQAEVAYSADRKQIVITLPPGHSHGGTLGRIQLYRPSAAGLDRSIELKTDASGVQLVDAAKLQPGLWKVKVLWTANGTDYQIDQRILVQADQS